MSEEEASTSNLFTFCSTGGCFAAGDPHPNEQVREGERECVYVRARVCMRERALYWSFHLLPFQPWSAACSDHDTHHLHEGTQSYRCCIGEHQPTVGW